MPSDVGKLWLAGRVVVYFKRFPLLPSIRPAPALIVSPLSPDLLIGSGDERAAWQWAIEETIFFFFLVALFGTISFDHPIRLVWWPVHFAAGKACRNFFRQSGWIVFLFSRDFSNL